MEKEIKVMTNIVKQTLIDRRNVILQEIQTSEAQRNELIVKRAEELFKEVLVDFPEISLSFSYGDTLYFNVDKKEIFSITSRRWGKDSNHYLNARSTDFYSFNVNSEFEYRRLIFNGKVAEVLYKGGMQSCIDQIFVEDDLLTIYKEQSDVLHTEDYALSREIDKMNREEAEEKRAKVLESFYNGEEVTFDEMRNIEYGRGRYDTVCRVVKLKCIDKNASGKKVTIEYTCLNYDRELVVGGVLEGVQTKYLIGQLV
tara:strand:+ start:1420 stop:2187 length:768 start_codon:yes stop_codon:yes gene_type:complete